MSSTTEFVITDGFLEKYTRSKMNVVIPDGVTSIGSGAFYKFKKLRSVIIPESVKRIGKGAFECCSSLKTVIISGNPEICDNAFYSCYRLSAESREVISKYNPNQSFGSFEE